MISNTMSSTLPPPTVVMATPATAGNVEPIPFDNYERTNSPSVPPSAPLFLREEPIRYPDLFEFGVPNKWSLNTTANASQYQPQPLLAPVTMTDVVPSQIRTLRLESAVSGGHGDSSDDGAVPLAPIGDNTTELGMADHDIAEDEPVGMLCGWLHYVPPKRTHLKLWGTLYGLAVIFNLIAFLCLAGSSAALMDAGSGTEEATPTNRTATAASVFGMITAILMLFTAGCAFITASSFRSAARSVPACALIYLGMSFASSLSLLLTVILAGVVSSALTAALWLCILSALPVLFTVILFSGATIILLFSGPCVMPCCD